MLAIPCKIDIIESFSCSKSGDESKNEDGLFANSHFVCVVDGATSKTDTLFQGKTGGQILKETILQSMQELTGKENHIEVIRFLQKRILMAKNKYQIEFATASLVIFSSYYSELWFIGDCQARMNSKTICIKHRIDHVLAEARSLAIRDLLFRGYTIEQLQEHDLGRDAILPFLKMQRYFENIEDKYGYCVLNTDESIKEPENLVTGYPVCKSTEIILASDGYPSLKNTLDESEKALFRLLRSDPLLYKNHPATTGLLKGNISFDDRTYIRFFVR